MSVQVRWLTIALLVSAAGVACGDDPKAAALPGPGAAGSAGSPPTTTCGPGTRLEDSQCVVDDGAGGSTTATCGPGTRLEDSQCVVDDGAGGSTGAAGSAGHAGASGSGAGEGGAGGVGGAPPTLSELCTAFCQQAVALGCPAGGCMAMCMSEGAPPGCEAEGWAYMACVVDQQLVECNEGNIQVTNPAPCQAEQDAYLICLS